MNWSNYQERVFDFVSNGYGNCFVEAVAGSGKTATIEEAIRRVPANNDVLAAAFNRSIKLELEERLGNQHNVEVKTLNAFGYGIVRDNFRGRIKVDGASVAKILKYEVIRTDKNSCRLPKDEFMLWVRLQRPVSRLISILKANMVFDLDEARVLIPLYAETHGIECSQELIDYTIQTYLLSLAKIRFIDFDDQIILPLRYNWDIPQFDFVFVDEAQDLSVAQIELIRRAGGRAIFVGDSKQAIYQFRGANSEAVAYINREFDCKQLPLSVCYRCSVAVVAAARTYVPQMEAGSSELGIVDETDFVSDAVGDNDLVLCRTTAPLVKECLDFIRLGRKAYVKGKDLGDDIKALVASIQAEGVIDLGIKIGERLRDAINIKKPEKRISVIDRLNTLLVLMKDCTDWRALDRKIDAIFCKTGKGVAFMTIHRAKGLEADRVFLIRRDLIPHPLSKDKAAEDNLMYVALTRAKREFYYGRVEGSPSESTMKQSMADHNAGKWRSGEEILDELS